MRLSRRLIHGSKSTIFVKLIFLILMTCVRGSVALARYHSEELSHPFLAECPSRPVFPIVATMYGILVSVWLVAIVASAFYTWLMKLPFLKLSLSSLHSSENAEHSASQVIAANPRLPFNCCLSYPSHTIPLLLDQETTLHSPTSAAPSRSHQPPHPPPMPASP